MYTKLLLCLSFLSFWGLGKVTATNLVATNPYSLPTLLQDGNFEYPQITGSPGFQYSPGGSWTFTNSAGYSRNNTGFTGGNPSAPQGPQVLFLQDTGRITRTIAIASGYYQFKFSAAQRGNHQASYQSIELLVDGQVVESFTPAGTTYESMVSQPIYLDSDHHSIGLRGTNPNGGDNTAFIDNFMLHRLRDISLSGFESPAVSLSAGFEYAPSGGPAFSPTGSGISRNFTSFTNGNAPAPEGFQVAFLQGDGYINLVMDVPETGFYRFRFKAARRGNYPAGTGSTKQLRISADNQEIGEFKLPDTDYQEMVSLAIHLTVGAHTLTLQGVNTLPGDHTGFVDDLRMEPLWDWNDPFVWGGSIPNSGDMATIDSSSCVVLHGNQHHERIMVKGQLLAAQNKDIDLTAKNIMVNGHHARFEIGQELAPYPSNATITLNATLADPNIGTMGNKFLGAMDGATLHLHGKEQQSWTQLGANAAPNASQITLKEPVNWQQGDKIVVVSSSRIWGEAEKRTITSVNGGGTILNLDAPLTHPHTGVVKTYQQGARTWTADLRAQVGRLSRNIKVQGDANSAIDGFGGHIMVMHHAKAFVGGVELFNMGQKGKLGRYPFHWHMLGNAGTGQYFKNSAVHQSYNRAVTIHGTESTLVENNFCYNHIGHGIFLEDGSERFNVIRKNVVLLSMRPQPGDEVIPSDNQLNEAQNRTPASFWITNPQNTFEDNVAAGTQGTGYWFAFPTKPLGASANDERFMNMKPHELPLISFKGNSAHSCLSGFDIFDQISADDSIRTNRGWNDSSLHYMDNCLWYANELAIYSGNGVGGPEENVIWRNNVFVENRVATMLASPSKVENAVFVANSGEQLITGERYAYRVYDGAGQVLNSHFVGWDSPNANLLRNTGAATKHPNHLFSGNTTDHTDRPRISLPDFDLQPGYAEHNSPKHPRLWSFVVRDLDGGLTGKPNTSLVSNHPFLLTGGEYQAPNWERAHRSDHHFVLSKLTYDGVAAQYPNVVCTRTKAGTPTERFYYVDGYKDHQQLPLIVNEDFEYTYQFESLPNTPWVHMHMDDATVGDTYIARFKDFGKFPSISIFTNQQSIAYRSSLAALRQSTTSCFYRDPNGDFWVKAVATRKLQRFSLHWAGSIDLPVIDTDGDQMADGTEIAQGRHPFAANDLAANFSEEDDFEGWTGIGNVSGAQVSGGHLSGTAVNNGDAIFSNNSFNFKAEEVPFLKVRMRASDTTGVQIFFGTNSNPGYSPNRVVTNTYNANNNWQTLTFPMSGQNAWNGNVTDLRLDPVAGNNIAFDVDWIKASATAKTTGETDATEASTDAFKAFPNPFGDQLEIRLDGADGHAHIQLIDLQGRILRREALAPTVRKLNWNLSDQPLSKGVYLLQLTGSKGTQTIKVLKD